MFVDVTLEMHVRIMTIKHITLMQIHPVNLINIGSIKSGMNWMDIRIGQLMQPTVAVDTKHSLESK